MKKIVNLTPHVINLIYPVDGEEDFRMDIEPSGETARVVCEATEIARETDDLIPIFEQKYGEIEGLPAPQDDTYYIVSSLIISAAQAEGRTTSDLLTPAAQVRDDEGRVIGCRGLAVH